MKEVYLLASVLALAMPAFGQQVPSEIGKVVALNGPTGSVIVMRGAKAYALQNGDLLFLGDRIITRSNGSVRISVDGCEKAIQVASSIVVDRAVCQVVPLTLAKTDVVNDIPIAADVASATSPVGASPALLGLLAAGGGAAAAAATNSGRDTN